MFPTKSAKISARSLRSLEIIYVFFSSFWFSGRNKSSWTRPYHECYEHKDIIYCTDKPCDLSTEYWGESYVSDPNIPQISARSQYSFFTSFWFSGWFKETYMFLTQSRKSAKFWLARSARSQPLTLTALRGPRRPPPPPPRQMLPRTQNPRAFSRAASWLFFFEVLRIFWHQVCENRTSRYKTNGKVNI